MFGPLNPFLTNLMFLLRNQQGINSITWYELATTSIKSKNINRICQLNIKKNTTVKISKQEYYITLPILEIWVEATQSLATNLNQIGVRSNK